MGETLGLFEERILLLLWYVPNEGWPSATWPSERCPCPRQQGWTRRPLKVPSSPNPYDSRVHKSFGDDGLGHVFGQRKNDSVTVSFHLYCQAPCLESRVRERATGAGGPEQTTVATSHHRSRGSCCSMAGHGHAQIQRTLGQSCRSPSCFSLDWSPLTAP